MRLWRSPQPKRSYDAVIVGAGGHGLATAYYLATVHGMTDVAVLERGWLGGGNMGRNTWVGVDLHPRAFPAGHVVQTLLARAQVIVEREDHRFLLYVRPSFAPYVESLIQARS